MSLKTDSTVINDVRYTCTQLNAKDAVRLQMKIAKFIGDAASSIKDLDGDAWQVAAIGGILQHLDNDEFFDGVYLKLINSCKKVDSNGNGSLIDFNNDFAGKLMDAHKVFVFALRVNYEDFINAVSSTFGGGKKAMEILENIIS